MPCVSGPSYEEERADRRTAVIPGAALCALLRVTSIADAVTLAQARSLIDWYRAGISAQEFSTWWHDHQEEDEARERREAEKKASDKRRADALAKLTPAERADLGLD